MLHLNTDAPYGLVRDIMVMAKGFVEPATSDLPLWVEATIHVDERDAMSVMHALRTYRIEGRPPSRAAYSDPVFVMAASNIEREGCLPSPMVAR